MSYTIRVSLPGYDALTDTNPDHFALYADEDWVLIKEYTRGSVSADNGGVVVYYLGLNYIPTILVYYQVGDTWQLMTGHHHDYSSYPSVVNLPYAIMIPQGMLLVGSSGTPTNFKYFICYDNNQA